MATAQACLLSPWSTDSPGRAGGLPDEVPPPCPSRSLMVPGEEVKDLLLAAGDGGQRFHDGAGRLPCSLCRRSKEHLQGVGRSAWLSGQPLIRPRQAQSTATHPGEIL